MEPFTKITSIITPLPLKDVDTDMLIPAQYLTSISRKGYGENLFRRLRDQDPTFPLNLPEYRESKILVADNNFGCGSSREHAVWALLGWGYRVVIAKSFADIFSGNSGNNGLVLVTLPEGEVDALLHRSASDLVSVTVDLDSQSVTFDDGRSVLFPYDPFRRHCILHGQDDLDYLAAKKAEIDQWNDTHSAQRFFSPPVAK